LVIGFGARTEPPDCALVPVGWLAAGRSGRAVCGICPDSVPQHSWSSAKAPMCRPGRQCSRREVVAAGPGALRSRGRAGPAAVLAL